MNERQGAFLTFLVVVAVIIASALVAWSKWWMPW